MRRVPVAPPNAGDKPTSPVVGFSMIFLLQCPSALSAACFSLVRMSDSLGVLYHLHPSSHDRKSVDLLSKSLELGRSPPSASVTTNELCLAMANAHCLTPKLGAIPTERRKHQHYILSRLSNFFGMGLGSCCLSTTNLRINVYREVSYEFL